MSRNVAPNYITELKQDLLLLCVLKVPSLSIFADTMEKAGLLDLLGSSDGNGLTIFAPRSDQSVRLVTGREPCFETIRGVLNLFMWMLLVI